MQQADAELPAPGALSSSVLASVTAEFPTARLQSSWQVTQAPPRPEAPGVKDQAPRAWSEAVDAGGPRGRCPHAASSRADSPHHPRVHAFTRVAGSHGAGVAGDKAHPGSGDQIPILSKGASSHSSPPAPGRGNESSELGAGPPPGSDGPAVWSRTTHLSLRGARLRPSQGKGPLPEAGSAHTGRAKCGTCGAQPGSQG